MQAIMPTKAIVRRPGQDVLQLALQRRDKRKLLVDEAAQCAASAICWPCAYGCGRNYHRGGRSAVADSAYSGSDNSRSLHNYYTLLAEIFGDISHRRIWFFSAAQIGDNGHGRPAARGSTWRAAARRHSGRMR